MCTNKPEIQRPYRHAYYLAHKDKADIASAKYRAEHKEEFQHYHREWYKKHRDKIRNLELLKRTGMTHAQKAEKLAQQDHLCAICFRYLPSNGGCAVCVDHDHATKKPRGILCAKCNKMLGSAEENIGVLLNAAEYLKQYQEA